MKLGISNLTWNDPELEEIIPLLKNNGIEFIEIILPKHINWNNNNLSKLYKFYNYLEANAINILSTQSLFFGSTITSYYDNNFIDHLKKVSKICKKIGVINLVLGAPTMRKNNNSVGLYNTFSYIDSIMKENKQFLLIEPNSRIYGGDYFYKVSEIIDFINKFTNIKTMIDTHNILLENENPTEVYLKNKNYIKHIHISEINLSGFIKSNYHIELANILKKTNYNDLIIYEAKPTSNLITEIKTFSETYNL